MGLKDLKKLGKKENKLFLILVIWLVIAFTLFFSIILFCFSFTVHFSSSLFKFKSWYTNI